MKKVKILGNIITVLALLLIVRRIVQFDIRWEDLLDAGKVRILLFCTLAYTLLVIVNHYPWRKLIEALSGQPQSLTAYRRDFLEVYTKSNLFKYIPGNVFQYVGRNELAFRLGLNHVQVATSTLIEIVLTVFAAALAALLLVWSVAIDYFRQHWKILAGLCLIGVLLLTGLFFAARKHEKLRTYIAQYKETMSTKKNMRTLFCCFLYYAFTFFYSGGLFLLVLRLCGTTDLSLYGVRIILGAYILSWVAGYITPGSPGGIGVRELVMMSVVAGSNLATPESITSALVIYRIITILGDVLAFAAVELYLAICRRHIRSF